MAHSCLEELPLVGCGDSGADMHPYRVHNRRPTPQDLLELSRRWVVQHASLPPHQPAERAAEVEAPELLQPHDAGACMALPAQSQLFSSVGCIIVLSAVAPADPAAASLFRHAHPHLGPDRSCVFVAAATVQDLQVLQPAVQRG